MSRRQAGWALFAFAFVVLGLPDYAHGVAWPDMRRELSRPLADLGVFLLVQAIGYLAVATSAGRLASRWTVEGMILRATLSAAVGLATIAVAPTWPVALLGGLLNGAGAGGMDTGFNAAVALRNDGRLMGLLHAGYGVGAAVGPVVVGASLVAGGGWRPAYAVFAVASVVLVAPLRGRAVGEAVPQQSLGSPRGAVLPVLVFFVYVGLEATVGHWAFTYLTAERGLGDLAAAAWVGVYWTGLTAGRFWLGVAGHLRSADRLLTTSVLGVAGGGLILWLGGSVAPAGLLLAGAALSVVFPVLMLLTPSRVGAERAAAAVGWQTAASALGAAAGPAAAGAVLDTMGTGAYGPVILTMAAVFALALAGLRSPPRRLRRRGGPIPSEPRT